MEDYIRMEESNVPPLQDAALQVMPTGGHERAEELLLDDGGAGCPLSTLHAKEQEAWEPDKSTNNNNINNTQYELSFMPRNQLAAIRLTLGLLAAILVVAALATVAACRQYRVVVATFWAMVLLAFVALAQLLQYAAKRDILPPVVRRAVQAVATEWEHFGQDWREQVLLLKQHPETTTATQEEYDNTYIHHEEATSATRSRSRIFRVLVQPWVPLLSRRRKRRQQQQQQDDRDAKVSTTTPY